MEVGICGGWGLIDEVVFDGLPGFVQGGALVGFVVGWEGVFLELAEEGEQAEVGVAQLALVTLEEGKVVSGGVLVEGGGEGLAGGFAVGLVHGVEVALGVGHALDFPEDLRDLRYKMVLEGGAGAELFVELDMEDFVGGVAFGGEEGGLGAAVFAGVLGDGLFACFGARAGGFMGVSAVGGEFAVGEGFFGRIGVEVSDSIGMGWDG